MEDWLSHLRASPSFASRLLPPLSSNRLTEAQGTPYDSFLQALAREDRSLAVDGLDLMAGGYLEFLRERLPQLLATLRSLRADELAEVGPALSGQPVWGRTVQGWASGALPVDRYISRIQVRRLDLPENLALRLLLKRLAAVAGRIVGRLGSRTHPEVVEIARRAEFALREPAVRAIGDPPGISEQLIRAAEGAVDTGYQVAGRLLRRRLALSLIDDIARWRRTAYAAMIGGAMLAPSDAEEIFELLALARVLDAFEHDLKLGAPASYWMRIGSNARRGPVAAFDDGLGGTVEVFFDRTPAFLLDAPTAYSKIFLAHEGLGSWADRRPDIVVVRRGPDRPPSTFFLEVKLPGGDGIGSYLRDSIYKGFGYLHDYAELWPPDQTPKVGLFVPAEAGPLPDATIDLVVLSAFRPADLPHALASSLGLEPPKQLLGPAQATCSLDDFPRRG